MFVVSDDFWTDEKKKEHEKLYKKYMDMMDKYCIGWCAECNFFTPDSKCIIYHEMFKRFYGLQ